MPSIVPAGPLGGLNTTDPSTIPDAPQSANRIQNPFAQAACAGPVITNPSSYWMTQMDHTGNARGYAPNIANYFTFPTWRNVMDPAYGAKNDGTGDQTAAIQAALNTDGRGGNRFSSGVVTAQPAHVFLPGGTYTLGSQLDLRLGTIIMGDPQNPPILKAAAGFTGSILVKGRDGETPPTKDLPPRHSLIDLIDAAGAPETSFLTALRNVVLE
jgi:glucan 1,3-beta-glucosidase